MAKFNAENVRAVLFDHDDTLVATIETKWAQHQHVAKTRYNRDLGEKDLREHWGKPLRVMVGLLYGTDDIDQAMDYIMLVRDDFPKRLFESTLGVVERIRQTARPVGIITAHSREGFELDLDELGIPRELFDYTQTADDTLFHKPDKRVFDPAIEWLDSMQIKPEQAMYVGDGLHDMQAANEAGLQFVGVETGLVTAQQFRSVGAVAVADLTELLPLVIN